MKTILQFLRGCFILYSVFYACIMPTPFKGVRDFLKKSQIKDLINIYMKPEGEAHFFYTRISLNYLGVWNPCVQVKDYQKNS